MSSPSTETAPDVYLALRKAIHSLLTQQPFYGEILQRFRIQISTKIPTAAVTLDVKATAFVVLINEEFFGSLTDTGRLGVLRHEVDHVLFQHYQFINDPLYPNSEMLNIAMDMSINCYNVWLQSEKELKDKCMLPQHFGFPQFKGTPEYYELLKQKAKPSSRSALDQHFENTGTKVNGPLTPEQVQQFNEKLGDLVEEVKKHLGAGFVPGHLQEVLGKLKKTSTRWRTLLRKSISNGLSSSHTERSYQKPNKKLQLNFNGTQMLLPSYIPTGGSNCVICVDTSGSVSEEELTVFFSEIKKINREYQKRIWVIQCDSEVTDVSLFSPHKKITVKGRGGTCFKPAIEAALKLKPKTIVYLTDGDNYDQAEVVQPVGVHVVWATTKTVPYDWGTPLKIEKGNYDD